MKEYLFDKKEEDNINKSESLINIEEYKAKSLAPDKREKYDIYVPMIKDDDDDNSEEDDFISVKKKDNYEKIMINLKNDIFSFIINKETYNNYPYLRVENTSKFIPKLLKESKILTEKKLIEIHSHLPYYHQYKDFKLLYNMDKDGTSLSTMIEKGSEYENTLLFIKTLKNEIFGAYLSESLRIKYNDFYGTAETFIFTFYDTDKIRVFPATQINDLYIYTDPEKLAFGCSDDNFSLSLENDFKNCFSGKTVTYNNLPLFKEKTENAIVVNCELWTLSI
jgi:hypothetical protein